MTKITFQDKEFYMDNRLNIELDDIHERVTKKDMDSVFIVDGAEGSGKSTLALMLASRLDPSFKLSRVCFSADEFQRVVRFETNKGQAVVYDEAYDSLNSKSSLNSVSQSLVTLMTEMRQKNLFIFIVLPSIHLLNSYTAVFRSLGLFHVYTKGDQRGFWCFFNYDKKKALYLNGKKFFSYSGRGIPNTAFRGRFYNQYPISEKDYKDKKLKALQDKWDNPKSKEHKKDYEDCNKLLLYLHDYQGLSTRKLSNELVKVKFKLTHQAINNRLKRAKELEEK